MAKKKGWFYLIKKLFVSEEQPKPEKKQKRWKWVFGRLRTKKLATLTAPSLPKAKKRDEPEDDQTKQALSVAIASTVAAEAAVAAAKAAVEVVWLHQYQEETAEPNTSFKALKRHREIHVLAAITIQTAFRGFLARKALRALKGIVRLQAIIRGRAVRRQAIATLKCLQSIVSIQSQVCSNRLLSAESTFQSDEIKQFHSLKEKIVKLDSKDKQWDDSILSKEEKDALLFSRKEALIDRARVKQYSSFRHRRSAESERKRVTGRWRYWLDQWIDTQLSKSKELEDLDSVFTSNPKSKEIVDQSPKPTPRRISNSHHRKQCSLGDGGELAKSLSSSPIVPAYMAATESAKARAQSSPKLRTGGTEAGSDGNSPGKMKQVWLGSSVASEGAIGGERNGRRSDLRHQRSPGMKGLAGATRSGRSLKDLSVDSERSFATWEQSGFR